MIKSCSKCSDYRGDAEQYQDKKYGKGRRVHNQRAKGGFRCTVCGHETIAGSTKK